MAFCEVLATDEGFLIAVADGDDDLVVDFAAILYYFVDVAVDATAVTTLLSIDCCMASAPSLVK